MLRNSGENLGKQVSLVNFLIVTFGIGIFAVLGRSTRLDGGTCLAPLGTTANECCVSLVVDISWFFVTEG
jgi:hypothetical protein